jgi:GNAT superfamily N-acetyltransferase
MDPILIREAGIEDIPHILHHRSSMYWDMGNQDLDAHRRMLVSAEACLRAAMPQGGYRGWMAETADGRVIAGVGIRIVEWSGSPDDPTPRRAWIQNVYTEPEFRRQGLAQRLMDTAVEWCRAEGFVSVSLHASVFGRPLYEKMGFEQTNEMRLRLRR